jgi:hypothetical protein
MRHDTALTGGSNMRGAEGANCVYTPLISPPLALSRTRMKHFQQITTILN